MTQIFFQQELMATLTANNAGVEWACADSDVQAEFLIGAANSIVAWGDGGNWPMQCRGIAETIKGVQRQAVASMLKTLVEHLLEPERDDSEVASESRG